MNTDKPIMAGAAPWSTAAGARELRARPRRPALAALRAGHPFARLKAALKPSGLRPLDLDFHPRRYSGLGLGFLAAGLLLAAAAVADYGSASDRVRHWRGEQARLQQASGRQAALRPGDAAAVQEATQAAAAVDADIKRPWEALFAAIEAAKSDDVALLSLSPDTARQSVRIAGEARDREAILAYIESLGQGGVLDKVVLIEDQLQQQDPEKPFRFMLTADWRLAAPAEGRLP
jgi:Tfp pilus assembly protein PilN